MALMNFEALHLLELDWIRSLHLLRTPLFDGVMKPFDFFDRQEFYFVLLPIVWFGVGWRWGLRLFYLLFLNVFINYCLKLIFAEPRPFQVDPALGIIQVGSFGFPSGAAQSVIVLSALLLSWQRSWVTWMVAGVYVLSVSFSRVYLGIHFPSDILGGWVIGLGIWGLFAYFQPRMEQGFENLSPKMLLLLSQVIPLALLVAVPGPTISRMGALGMGIGLGLWMKCPLALPCSVWKKGGQILLAILTAFCFYELSKGIVFESEFLTLVVRYYLLGVWVSAGMSFLVGRFERLSDLVWKRGSSRLRT